MGLLSPPPASERRGLIDPLGVNNGLLMNKVTEDVLGAERLKQRVIDFAKQRSLDLYDIMKETIDPQSWINLPQDLERAFPSDPTTGRLTPEGQARMQQLAMNIGLNWNPMAILSGKDYRGLHTAPGRDSGAPGYDLTGKYQPGDMGKIYPDDIYSYKAAQYYGHFGQNDPMDRQSIALIQGMKNHPDRLVTVYRAVPKDVKAGIEVGDWVTINRQYAKQHGESTLLGDYKIVKKTVHARDIFTNGDSIHEWGYDPQPYTPISERHPDLWPGWFKKKMENK